VKSFSVCARSVNDVAQALVQAKARGRSAALLIGAGASVTAGVPLADGMVDAIRQHFPDAHARAQKPTYPYVMQEITDGNRHDLIAGFVREAKLNWTHLLLGWLVRSGYIGRILTTNFDNLSVRCTALYDVYPAVYDVTALGKFDASMVHDPAIFFLHGQHSGFVQLNTESEVNMNARRLKPVFEEANLGRPWIVLGYSGANDPVFERLAAIKRFNYGLYWVGYRESPPSPDVTERLLAGNERQTYLVGGHDADSFMIALFRALNLEVPPLLRDPFAHGLATLAGIPPFPSGVHGDGLDLTAVARSRLHAAQKWFIAGEPPMADAELHTEQLLLALQGYYLRGDYDTIIAKAGETDLPEPVRAVVAAAHIARAELHSTALRAAQRGGEPTAEAFQRALADLDRAVVLLPGFAEAYNERAALRLHAVDDVHDAAFDALMVAVREDLAEALRRKPNLAPALHNVAYCDALVGQRQAGETRHATLQRALDGFRRALEVQPDQVLSLAFAARTLLNLDRSPAAVREVTGLLERAARIEPRNYEVLVSRLHLAFQAIEWDFERMKAQAPELLAIAETLVEVDAVDPRGTLLLGLVRMMQAMLTEEPAARAAFDGGRAQFESARARPSRLLGSILGDAELGLACMLWVESLNRNGEARARMTADAEAGLTAAVATSGPVALCLWGHLLTHAAEQVEGAEAAALVERAEGKFREALARKPDHVQALVDLAELYIARVEEAASPNDAAAWVGQATELLERAAAAGEETAEIRRLQAAACRVLGEALEDETEERQMLQEAIDRYTCLVEEDADDAEAWAGLGHSAQAWAECFEDAPPTLDGMRAAFRTAENAFGRAGPHLGVVSALMHRVEVLASWGEVEEEFGHPAEAAKLTAELQALLEEAVQRAPNDHDLMLMLIGWHAERDDRYAFKVMLHRAAAMQPPLTQAELAEEGLALLEAPVDPDIAVLLGRLPRGEPGS
jgi:hypothetical protein